MIGGPIGWPIGGIIVADEAVISSAVGAAAGTGDAPGIGISTAAAVGAASGSGDAPGIGASTAEAVGAAAGAGDAPAIGTGLAPAIGTAAGAGDASGIGAATGAGVGTASGTGDASGFGAAVLFDPDVIGSCAAYDVIGSIESDEDEAAASVSVIGAMASYFVEGRTSIP